jgi:hypothetical protein
MSAVALIAPHGVPATVRTLPFRARTPHWDPPYDDELPVPLPTAPPWCEPLPLAVPAPGTLSREQASPPRQRPGAQGLPDARTRATTMVRALVEVIAGERPASHLARYATLDVQQVLAGLVPPVAARRRPWGRTVRSIHVTEPSTRAVEVSAVITRGDRCAAVALRLEARGSAWVITALEVG